MSAVVVSGPKMLIPSCSGFKSQRGFIFRTLAMDIDHTETAKKNERSVQVPAPPPPECNKLRTSGLQFNRLQPLGHELNQENSKDFGQYVAREAVLDEEYWTAAWLRAESHWENRINDRYAESYKRRYAEKEFYTLKRRCKGQLGQLCTCVVMVRKGEKVQHTVLKSVVGTLDLSIRSLLPGQTFPEERVEIPPFSSFNKRDPKRYGYIANLCVAKSARRQGIASNMLHSALESAKSNGVEVVYVHVHRNNKPAQELYKKIGFEVVELASPQLIEEQTFLLCLKI